MLEWEYLPKSKNTNHWWPQNSVSCKSELYKVYYWSPTEPNVTSAPVHLTDLKRIAWFLVRTKILWSWLRMTHSKWISLYLVMMSLFLTVFHMCTFRLRVQNSFEIFYRSKKHVIHKNEETIKHHKSCKRHVWTKLEHINGKWKVALEIKNITLMWRHDRFQN
jgi:hypothetical protein